MKIFPFLCLGASGKLSINEYILFDSIAKNDGKEKKEIFAKLDDNGMFIYDQQQ